MSMTEQQTTQHTKSSYHISLLWTYHYHVICKVWNQGLSVIAIIPLSGVQCESSLNAKPASSKIWQTNYPIIQPQYSTPLKQMTESKVHQIYFSTTNFPISQVSSFHCVSPKLLNSLLYFPIHATCLPIVISYDSCFRSIRKAFIKHIHSLLEQFSVFPNQSICSFKIFS